MGKLRLSETLGPPRELFGWVHLTLSNDNAAKSFVAKTHLVEKLSPNETRVDL